MPIFAIDDEPKSLRMLHKAIAEAAPQADIQAFPLSTAAIEAITAHVRASTAGRKSQQAGCFSAADRKQ